MSSFSDGMAKGVSHTREQVDTLVQKLAALRQKPGVPENAVKAITELEELIQAKLAESFQALGQVPGQTAADVEKLREKGERLSQLASERKAEAERVRSEKMAKLEAGNARRLELIAAKKKGKLPTPDLTLAPDYGEELRRHFGLPALRRSTQADEGRSFDSWIGDTPSPESVVARTKMPFDSLSRSPVSDKKEATPEKGISSPPSSHGFESWAQGNESVQESEVPLEPLTGGPPTDAPSAAEVGLNTWLHEANPSEQSDQPSVGEVAARKARQRFEQWLHAKGLDQTQESSEE